MANFYQSMSSHSKAINNMNANTLPRKNKGSEDHCPDHPATMPHSNYKQIEH